MRRALTPAAIAALALMLDVATMRAQSPDSLRLGALQRAAARRDPRLKQLELSRAQSALRQQDLDAERLPKITGESQAQYQSDVTKVPIRLPSGGGPPTPPHDTYDAHLSVQEQLLDPSLAPRRAVERAQAARTDAQVRTNLYAIRQQVNDAYFSAALLDARAAELRTGLTDLNAQLVVARQRVLAGAALPSDTAALRAEWLRRTDDLAQLVGDAGAWRQVLAELTGSAIDSTAPVVVPDLASVVVRTRAGADTARARPEFAQFARDRELIARQSEALVAQNRPRVSAFARAGYGKPGLNFLNDTFDTYWLGGLQLQWTPWNWGTTRRQREALELQRDVVATEESSFRDALARSTVRDLATIDRLTRTLASDDELVTLRDGILRETLSRFREGVITSAEYVDRETDVLSARVLRATHRVELAQARARYLTTLGLEIP